MSERGVGSAAVLAALLFAVGPGDSRPAGEPDPAELLRRADAARHTVHEGLMRIRAVVREEGESPVESELDVFVQGEDRVLCVFRSGRLAGRKILVREDRGKVWLLTPGSSRAIPITSNQLLLGGASIADVARQRLAGHYDAVARPGTERVDGVECRVLDLQARSRDTSYASAVLWVGVADGLARRARFSLRSGKESKEIRFVEYDESDDGQARLRRMEIDHLLRAEQGMVTILEFLRFDPRPLDSRLFDPEGARELPWDP